MCILCRIQLTVCVSQILRHDFPDKWPGVINKVNGFLAENSQGTWMGALLTLYQIVKKYELVLAVYCYFQKIQACACNFTLACGCYFFKVFHGSTFRT